MHAAIYAIVGITLAVAMAVGFSLIRVPSGDRTIEPEGERDPGRHGWPAKAVRVPEDK